jgi:hypothetical protein
MKDRPRPSHEMFQEMHRRVTASLRGNRLSEPGDRLDELIRQDLDACDLYLNLVFESSALLTWAKQGGPEDTGKQSPSGSAPVPTFLTTDFRGTAGYFSSGWPVAYLVATVILGIGLWIGAVTPVSHSVQVAKDAHPPAPLVVGRQGELVGRITGMVDCVWQQGSEVRGQGSGTEDPKSHIPNLMSHVSLGDRFALASGLMEITYDSGAKVILQGPATYAVESAAGGFLSVGKLTARLEKGEGGRGRAEGGRGRAEGVASGQWPVAGGDQQSTINNQQSSDPKSQISNRSSPFPLPPSTFAVRTPSAIITDLGTEFGVEVDKQGATTSHVFRGCVQVQLVSSGVAIQGNSLLVLHTNESARAERIGDARGQSLALRRDGVTVPAFVRRIADTSPEVLDVLDIVAGGYGKFHRRERGVNPTTGQEAPLFYPGSQNDDGHYHPVDWHKLVDGVFVPNGAAGAVVIDSAGGVFRGFPKTSGENYCTIWARAVDGVLLDPTVSTWAWPYAVGRGERFMPERRGLLCLHPNAGITLNLAAMRETNPGKWPRRFRALAAMFDRTVLTPGPPGLADLWILVDGKLKLERVHYRPQDNPIRVDIELGRTDRFFTLAATDGGNGANGDLVVFGDPVFEMASEKRP